MQPVEERTRPIIEIEELAYVYNPGSEAEAPALKDVSLTVGRGEFVAVVGANGSGKSTLARHLNALLTPTAGRVLVDQLDTRDPDNLWRVRQTVGMVFQNPDNQMVATTVEEDVAFGPENLGLPREEILRRIGEALAAVGMGEFRERAPHHLSGGQKQRVAIAGILAMRPRVLVLDEATAMLDPRGRGEVLQTVQRLNRGEGITVVYITHFMEEAAVADRIVVMAGGRITATGAPVDIFSRSAELRAAGLDIPQVSALAARLRGRGLPLPQQIVTLDDLVGALCQLPLKR